MERLEFLDMVETGKHIVKILMEEEKVDFILALTQNRMERDMELKREIPEISLILGVKNYFELF